MSNLIQNDLFRNPRERRLVRGRQYRDSGVTRVGRNNEEFLFRCRQFAIDTCRRDGKVTIEQVRVFATCNNLIPNHPNAWGAIFKTRYFKPVGFTQNAIESAHARLVRVWIYEPA